MRSSRRFAVSSVETATGHTSVSSRRRAGRRTGFDMRVSPYLFVLPFFVVFAIFGLFPALYTFYVSMFRWTLGDEAGKEFVGLGNYADLMADANFWNALVNTIGIFLIATVPQIVM